MGRSRPLSVYFRPFLITISIIQIDKAQKVCLGFEPAAAGWLAQTIPRTTSLPTYATIMRAAVALLINLSFKLFSRPNVYPQRIQLQSYSVYIVYNHDRSIMNLLFLKGPSRSRSLTLVYFYFDIEMQVTCSVTRRLECIFNIWPFSTMKICPKAYKLSQKELKTLSKPNKPEIFCQRVLNIGQSGRISPNLVTLVT